MLIFYGIPNCDTVRKARAYLESRGIAYTFHDYKRAGPTASLLQDWCAALGWERVLNRAGQTFRKLDPAAREGLDQARAIALMMTQPSMIRRPILQGEHAGAPVLLAGFSPDVWDAALP